MYLKFKTSFASALILFTMGSVSTAAESPNLIVIMADDLGYADVGFNGCEDIPTPHIDSLAKNGVKCTSAYTSYSVCGPSRAGFLTGRYQQRFGFERNPLWLPESETTGLTKEEMTIAESLKKVGYHCGLIGKWHMGAHEIFHPLNRGFDEFFGHIGGGHRYLPEDLTIASDLIATSEKESYLTLINRNRIPVQTTKYLTDEFSDEAVNFVERNKQKPFFLFLSYNAPHGPLQATEQYLARFPHIKNKNRRIYAAMVSALDDGVGRLVAKLKTAGVYENTMIVFLSDNGGPEKKNFSDNGVLRGKKSDPWEGGFRVPFAIQWPAKIKNGSVYDKPVSSLDIFATISALSKSPTHQERPLDGKNLIPYFLGQETSAPHENIYLRKFDQGAYALRRDKFKLVIPSKGAKPELYNLDTDTSEKNNLADQEPEKVVEMMKLLRQWESELIEPTFKGLMSKKGKH